MFKRLLRLIYHRIVFLRLYLPSLRNWIYSWFKKTSIFKHEEYHQQPILLLAIFEKKELRQDIKNLLMTAKQLGFYIIGVNSLKLNNPANYSSLIDIYIERYNYGRDFGSYKIAIQYVYQHNIEKTCPRLLLLNDSVFYSQKNLEGFLLQLRDAKLEAVGATENHEISHHLGSFCLSLCPSVFKQNQFKKFWRNYRLTDVRPKVILKGEMGLSKIISACISAPEEMQALYNLYWLTEQIRKQDTLLTAKRIFFLTRKSSYSTWKRPQLREIVNGELTQHTIYINSDGKDKNSIKDQNAPIFFFQQSELNSENLQIAISTAPDPILKNINFDQLAQQSLLECFSQGSQIHNNGILLYFLGLPILKLDGLYRGVWLISDVEKIAGLMPESEANEFRRLLYLRIHGEISLSSWRLAAFRRGFL